MILGPRQHAYVARRHLAPAELPDGRALIELGDLIRHITRAQDPNVPGFDPASIVADYPFWPFHRYGPLLVSHRWLRGRRVIDRLDPRKKGIVAEDIGLGFAAHAMSLLGANPMMTKWEIDQPDRRRLLAAVLRATGAPARQASQTARLLTKGLRGADFVGWSVTRGRWVVCESKGSLNEPPTRADIARYATNPAGPGIGRRGPTKTVTTHQRGLRQKRETEQEIRDWGFSDVLSIAVFSSIGSEGNRRRTVVDYVDPIPPPELSDAVRASQPALREWICQAHFRWIAALFGLQLNPWRAGDALWRDLGANGLVRDIVVPLAAGPLRIEARVGADALDAIASGSIEALDRYALLHPRSPDGLACRVVSGPDFAAEDDFQIALDRATLDSEGIDIGMVGRDPLSDRPPLELEDS